MDRMNKKNIFIPVVVSLLAHSIVIAGIIGGFGYANSLGTSEKGGRGLGVGVTNAVPQYIQVSSISVEASSEKDSQSLSSNMPSMAKDSDSVAVEVKRKSASKSSPAKMELGDSGSIESGGTGSEGRATELSLYVREVKKLIGEKSFYPQSAKRRGLEGTVNVSFSVSSDGSVYDVDISKPSGFNLLDDNALSIVKSASPLPAPPRSDLRLELPLVFSIQTVW